MSAPSLLQVGVVGLGRMGRRHADNLATLVPGAALCAVCSPVAAELDWARQHYPEARQYQDYEALLAHPGLQAVFLVTPTALHAGQIITALRAGKHVFCEKPLSLELEDCLRVQTEAARHPQLKVMTGFVRRFDASYQDARRKIDEGLIGAPFMVYSQTCDAYDPDGFFVRFAPTSGGLFLDCSVHDIDLARWLLGEVRAVRVIASGVRAIHHDLAPYQDVDNGLAICEFEGGRLASFYASRTMAHGHETMTEVTGTRGRISVGANPHLNRVTIADTHGVRSESTPSFIERFSEAFVTEARHFVDAVRFDRPLALSLGDAAEATRIGMAMRKSLLEQQPVSL
nr:Gfo/Idh/MocA family oxidoreductase [Herbaspirillum sp. ASV7]